MLQTVIAIKQDGMDTRAIALNFEVPNKQFDLKKAAMDAATEFCKTEEGRKVFDYNCSYFDWADFATSVPNEICEKFGFSMVNDTLPNLIVNWDEQLVNESKLTNVMDEHFESLKEDLFRHGQEAIENFLGYEIDPEEDKDVTENRLDEVYMQMPEEEFQRFVLAYGSGMKAVNIEWDIDDVDVDLPSEIGLPKGMVDVEEISDYLSDVTGFCPCGYKLAASEKQKPSLSEQIQNAEARAAQQPDHSETIKGPER